MSDTPRTKAATRMAFTSEYMVEIEAAQKLERELADMTKQIDPYEREAAKAAINVLKRQLADMTKQRDELAASLKSLCIAIISEEPQDITDLLKQSGAAIAAVEGGSHDERALELATALEAELLAQYDKLDATMQRPEFASFPIDERIEIDRKHTEISGLLTQADFMKYQISRL